MKSRAEQLPAPARIRLGDRLLAPGTMVGVWSPGLHDGEKDLPMTPERAEDFRHRFVTYRKLLPTIPWIILDPVSEFYYQRALDSDGTPQQFPLSVPPFPLQWVESVAPPIEGWLGARRWGAFIQKDLVTDWRSGKVEWPHNPSSLLEEVSPEAHWVISTFSFVEWNTPLARDQYLSFGFLIHALNHAGDILPGANSRVAPYVVAPFDDWGELPWQHSAGVKGVLDQITEPFWLGFSLMNARNVSLEDQAPPAKLSRAFARRHRGQPLHSYKVLKIWPHVQRTATTHEGSLEDTPHLLARQHLVRGHFRDYRTNGLGRYHVKGIFWFQQHLRGHLEEGTVTKAYEQFPGKE